MAIDAAPNNTIYVDSVNVFADGHRMYVYRYYEYLLLQKSSMVVSEAGRVFNGL